MSLVQCDGNKKTSEPQKGVNTPPFINSAEIMPLNPILGSRVRLRIDAGDKEGDILQYNIHWYVNNREIGEGLEVFLDTAERGDEIYAIVTPSDGKLQGEPFRTDAVTIGNTPPVITSSRIMPDTVLTSTGTLTIIGQGYDPDNDPITWLCYWTLDYETRIPDSTVTIDLSRLDLKKGSHISAELYAYDGDTVSTPHVLEIDIVNSAPIINSEVESLPYRPGALDFAVPIIDPDKDPLAFELLDAPYGITIDRTTGVITGQINETEPFQILVRATDSEGAYLEARFTLTPVGQPE
jgi:hypothetical protein